MSFLSLHTICIMSKAKTIFALFGMLLRMLTSLFFDTYSSGSGKDYRFGPWVSFPRVQYKFHFRSEKHNKHVQNQIDTSVRFDNFGTTNCSG